MFEQSWGVESVRAEDCAEGVAAVRADGEGRVVVVEGAVAEAEDRGEFGVVGDWGVAAVWGAGVPPD